MGPTSRDTTMESVAAPLRCSQPGWLAGRIYLGAFSDGDDDRKEGILYDILIYIYIYIYNQLYHTMYIYISKVGLS